MVFLLFFYYLIFNRFISVEFYNHKKRAYNLIYGLKFNTLLIQDHNLSPFIGFKWHNSFFQGGFKFNYIVNNQGQMFFNPQLFFYFNLLGIKFSFAFGFKIIIFGSKILNETSNENQKIKSNNPNNNKLLDKTTDFIKSFNQKLSFSANLSATYTENSTKMLIGLNI